MSKNYDNWERLVRAVLRRENDWQIALCDHSSFIISQSFPSNHVTSSRFYNEQSFAGASTSQFPAVYSDLSMDHADWKALLPPDEHEVVWKSASMSFSLDQRTGKNCFMLGPSRLGTSFGQKFEHYWTIKSYSESRFSEVAQLIDSFVFSIRCSINARMLSPETSYTAYLVFRLTETCKNLVSANSFIKHFYDLPDDIDSSGQTRIVFFAQGDATNGHTAVRREDGWMEMKIGDFYVPQGDKRNVEVTVLELSAYEMSGLIVEGIEFRPLEIEITPLVSKKNEEKRNRRGKRLFSNFKIS